jgi:hypothetical protein
MAYLLFVSVLDALRRPAIAAFAGRISLGEHL